MPPENTAVCTHADRTQTRNLDFNGYPGRNVDAPDDLKDANNAPLDQTCDNEKQFNNNNNYQLQERNAINAGISYF